MSLRIAFQMDPLSEVDINADTTFRLIEEAQKRGHSNYVYNPETLKFDQGAIKASGSLVKVDREADTVVCLEEQTELSLNSFDIIWLRQDPPFDMLYITTTHILDLISPNVLVVNNPFWVRNFPEKLLVLQFPKLIPPTLISRDLEAMKKFHNDIELKYKYFIPYNQKNYKSLFPKGMKVTEIGSWNNVYRGVNGFHYVALGNKIGKK